jgi:hypothetical protein
MTHCRAAFFLMRSIRVWLRTCPVADFNRVRKDKSAAGPCDENLTVNGIWRRAQAAGMLTRHLRRKAAMTSTDRLLRSRVESDGRPKS